MFLVNVRSAWPWVIILIGWLAGRVKSARVILIAKERRVVRSISGT